MPEGVPKGVPKSHRHEGDLKNDATHEPSGGARRRIQTEP